MLWVGRLVAEAPPAGPTPSPRRRRCLLEAGHRAADGGVAAFGELGFAALVAGLPASTATPLSTAFTGFPLGHHREMPPQDRGAHLQLSASTARPKQTVLAGHAGDSSAVSVGCAYRWHVRAVSAEPLGSTLESADKFIVGVGP